MEWVLFLCPHNAAKSILATVYFNKRMADIGTEARAFSAGTEPDEEVALHVATLLYEEGYSRPEHKPRQVNQADLDKADRIVSIGCDLRGLSTTGKQVTQWNDVPPPSKDLQGAWREVKARVDELIFVSLQQ